MCGHLLQDVVVLHEYEHEHVVDVDVQLVGRVALGRVEHVVLDRALEGGLVLRPNCCVELAREGAEAPRVGREAEDGERRPIDQGLRRRRTGRSCHSIHRYRRLHDGPAPKRVSRTLEL